MEAGGGFDHRLQQLLLIFTSNKKITVNKNEYEDKSCWIQDEFPKM